MACKKDAQFLPSLHHVEKVLLQWKVNHFYYLYYLYYYFFVMHRLVHVDFVHYFVVMQICLFEDLLVQLESEIDYSKMMKSKFEGDNSTL